jgi:hypothetical protein
MNLLQTLSRNKLQINSLLLEKYEIWLISKIRKDFIFFIITLHVIIFIEMERY